jgi:hypothetical protein
MIFRVVITFIAQEFFYRPIHFHLSWADDSPFSRLLFGKALRLH